MNCKNCGVKYYGNFCPKCGRPTPTKSPDYCKCQTVSMSLLIAGIFGIIISVGPLSCLRLIRGDIHVGQAIVGSDDMLRLSVVNLDVSGIAWFLIPLFYVSLILLVAASIVALLKNVAVKNILASLSLIITAILGIALKSPIEFFIFLNVGMLIFMMLFLIELNQSVWNICWGVALPFIFIGNLFSLIAHRKVLMGSVTLAYVSFCNIFMMLLWCIPCVVHLITLFQLKANLARYVKK